MKSTRYQAPDSSASSAMPSSMWGRGVQRPAQHVGHLFGRQGFNAVGLTPPPINWPTPSATACFKGVAAVGSLLGGDTSRIDYHSRHRVDLIPGTSARSRRGRASHRRRRPGRPRRRPRTRGRGGATSAPDQENRHARPSSTPTPSSAIPTRESGGLSRRSFLGKSATLGAVGLVAGWTPPSSSSPPKPPPAVVRRRQAFRPASNFIGGRSATGRGNRRRRPLELRPAHQR